MIERMFLYTDLRKFPKMNFLWILLFIYSREVTSNNYCYWNSGCSYKYFSSKTPYDTVRGDIRDSIIKLKGCEPISIWGIYSHGKSDPDKIFTKNIQEVNDLKNNIIESYENGNCSLCAQDVQNIENWQIDKKLYGEPLTKEGYQDMLGIGSRFRRAFSKLTNNLQSGSSLFHSSSTSQAEESAKAFIKGFQNKELPIIKVKNGHDLIAPHVTCQKYQKDVLQNPRAYDEINKYKSTLDYLAAQDKIQRRLGVDKILSDDNIKTLYDLCRYFWSGIENKFSPWCAIFTTGDLKVLEYIEDLEHYYKYGYGSPISELLARVPLTDLLNNFQKAKEGTGKKFVAYFSDSPMINMACTALKLYKDEKPPTGAHRDSKRRWRTSRLSAFSANLVAVLNRCKNNGEDDYNVIFYWNEQPLLSICEEGICSWQEFEDKFKPLLNSTLDFCDN